MAVNVQKQVPGVSKEKNLEKATTDIVKRNIDDDKNLGAFEKQMLKDDYDRYAKLLNRWFRTHLNQLAPGEKPYTAKDETELKRLYQELKPYLPVIK